MSRDNQHAFELQIQQIGYVYKGTEIGDDGVLRKVWQSNCSYSNTPILRTRENFESPSTAKRYWNKIKSANLPN